MDEVFPSVLLVGKLPSSGEHLFSTAEKRFLSRQLAVRRNVVRPYQKSGKASHTIFSRAWREFWILTCYLLISLSDEQWKEEKTALPEKGIGSKE